MNDNRRKRHPRGARFFPASSASLLGIFLWIGISVFFSGSVLAADKLTARQLVHNLKMKTYSGDLVELRFNGSNPSEVFSKFEEISGFRFKVIPALDFSRKNYTFLGSPWDKALASILLDHSLELHLEQDLLVVDLFKPETSLTIPAFLIGISAGAVLFGGIILVLTRRRRRRRILERERKITLDAAAQEEAIQRLNYLFQVEKIHRNGRLTLDSLAERLALQPYQLSGIVNSRMGKTFTDLVSDFRIEEVKKRLADPAESAAILHIAYDAGFGTKASFNRIFKKRTGLTPSEFKKKSAAAK